VPVALRRENTFRHHLILGKPLTKAVENLDGGKGVGFPEPVAFRNLIDFMGVFLYYEPIFQDIVALTLFFPDDRRPIYQNR